MKRRATQTAAFAFTAAVAACSGELRFADHAAGDAATTDGPASDGYVDYGTRCGSAGVCGGSTSCCYAANPNPKCVANGGAESCAGLMLPCDDAQECSESKVCCAQFEVGPDGGNLIHDVSCQDPPSCPSGSLILCDPNAPGACPTCHASTNPQLPPGYSQCN